MGLNSNQYKPEFKFEKISGPSLEGGKTSLAQVIRQSRSEPPG